jgi:hypothetical protein
MLCTFALKAYDKYGTKLNIYNHPIQRGFLINYEMLPGVIPRIILPLSGIDASLSWLSHMIDESTFYSKSRNRQDKLNTFEGDSQDKEQRSTQAIQQYSKSLLEPNYIELNKKSFNGLDNFDKGLANALKNNLLNGDNDPKKWSELSAFPNSAIDSRQLSKLYITASDEKQESYNNNYNNNHNHNRMLNFNQNNNNNTTHSATIDNDRINNDYYNKHSNFAEIPYSPWSPFSNTHLSQPIEVCY